MPRWLVMRCRGGGEQCLSDSWVLLGFAEVAIKRFLRLAGEA